MNDSSFSNYENYFCTSSHQVTEINPLTQNIEYDEMPATIHYINNVSSGDMVTTLTQSVSGVEQRHPQNNVFNFLPNSHEEQEKLESQSVSKRVNSSSAVVSNVPASSTHFGGIPFVQIHTTNVQPQRTSYGNVFRRNISRQEEIKSEPIKSETSEASKERTNATPTPPRTANQTQNENNMEPMDTSTNEKQSNSITNNNNIEEKSSALLQIYKCSKCPYISLRETERDDHIASQHKEESVTKSEQLRPINCPGCSNIFYQQESLKIHLKLDHLMREEDVPKLLNTFIESKKKSNDDESNASLEIINKTLNTETTKEPIRKSRIYLKNVECLREPNRQPMEQTDNQLAGPPTTNHTQQPTKPKQKISIKSVDVLREPALLRRDYEIQNSNINNYLNFNTDLLNNTLDLLAGSPLNLGNNTNSSSYDYPQTMDNTLNKSNINNNDCSLVNTNTNTNNVATATEKPRRPKIYVKSVESFNLMPLDSLHANNNGGFLNDHSTSCNNNQVYDSTLVHMPPPYMFDTNSSGNNLNNNANFISNHSDMDTFQFINTSNANNNNNNNNNYILENTLFLGNNEELNVNGEQMENIALIPDAAATPTPPSTADINMIMTKPVSTIQEQRGTLHLRTVDELNLMNKTEVQHLIAPNLDNNHTSEVLDKVNSSSLNDINLIGDDLYEDDHFKFHDLDTQMVNDWPETYEDLAEDINCIIADASNENSAENLVYSMENNNQKLSSNNFDIDTPQVSLITIRDIEELTGTANHIAIDQQTDLIVEQIQDSHNEIPNQIDIVSQEEDLLVIPRENESVGDSSLKRELVNATPETNETSVAANVKETNVSKEISKNITPVNELPPLVPVTNNSTESTESINLHNSNVNPLTNSNIPLPPLVPVSPLKKLNNVNKQPDKPTSPLEKGRIYVANNLMEPPKRPTAVSATSGTSVRGRPFGSNRTRITKLKQTIGSSAEDLFSKCSIKGCAFRFKKPETVEYHRKCHDMSSDSPQAMLCPECKSSEFNNWNTLHTHLWRAHQIDMELYKCELCEFKTPIFSRLVNTHAKIHFEDRNYKCEHCEKAFKNSKQLKNHRRWHRVQATAAITTTTPPKPPPPPTEIHRCSDCGSTFSQQKTLREHCCKKGDSSLKCNVCEKLMSSKSSLKLHLLTHSDGEKLYKCQNCDYATNDHNAFRRHRMGHENRKMYECIFCPYKSVQSVAYQKHILQKHPENADSVIYKCSVCSYSTINRSLLVVHQAKHEKPNDDRVKSKVSEDISAVKNTEKSVIASSTDLQKSKIKVKSNLFTTNSTEAVVNVNHNDLNLVQLYNVESGTVT
ncbi:putative uncharacterized protein DDB_G0277255 [Lucilia cuprina]|uniref:putative uncharacterized protein DDB_G0277255 n=1 Tax=Lucilia cuprina TaxID=7375 RepID=UPI001F06D884|nr:putative uncharacterized protein DDB_G0277255 [Lucilia cuprina]